MAVPHVYAAIASVTSALGAKGIEKSRNNVDDNYRFRGIDDIYEALSPLLAEHKLCILPRTTDRTLTERRGTQGRQLSCVCLKVSFDLVSAVDGSSHAIEVFGEAMDASDKATSKAMSAAFKSAVLQCFCVPVGGREDADLHSPTVDQASLGSPPGGWQAWTDGVLAVVRAATSDQALDQLQQSNLHILRALAAERRDLYDEIGQEVRARRLALAPKPRRSRHQSKTTRAPSVSNGEDAAHAAG